MLCRYRMFAPSFICLLIGSFVAGCSSQDITISSAAEQQAGGTCDELRPEPPYRLVEMTTLAEWQEVYAFAQKAADFNSQRVEGEHRVPDRQNIVPEICAYMISKSVLTISEKVFEELRDAYSSGQKQRDVDKLFALRDQKNNVVAVANLILPKTRNANYLQSICASGNRSGLTLFRTRS